MDPLARRGWSFRVFVDGLCVVRGERSSFIGACLSAMLASARLAADLHHGKM